MRYATLLLLLVAWIQPYRAAGQIPDSSITGGRIACQGGTAAGFPCRSVDLLSFLPISELGNVFTGSRATLNDVWGWTDPETGREYAVVGRSDGTAFVDVSDPENPVFLGLLATHTRPSLWRDVKVLGHHALVVADHAGAHGLQIFDLHELREVTSPPVLFDETAHYSGFEAAHNVAVNEETGYAYVVGIHGEQVGACGPGLHFVDLREPTDPQYAGCFADLTTGREGSGYTHDAQCVVYQGPDEAYRGREICFGSNENALSIADVTAKDAPAAISATGYDSVAYAHQGWLTEDHRYFLLDDELDERTYGLNTRTIIWDVSDLDEPFVISEYTASIPSIDHNQYVVDSFTFQANYTGGLRILDIRDIERPVEVAYFDTYPPHDSRLFEGAWSTYPFFRSGVVLVSSIGEGLFVLDPRSPVDVAREGEPKEPPAGVALEAAYPNPFNPRTTVALSLGRAQHARVAVYDPLGREVRLLHEGLLEAGTGHRFTFDAGRLPSGIYWIRAVAEDGTDARPVMLVK